MKKSAITITRTPREMSGQRCWRNTSNPRPGTSDVSYKSRNSKKLSKKMKKLLTFFLATLMASLLATTGAISSASAGTYSDGLDTGPVLVASISDAEDACYEKYDNCVLDCDSTVCAAGCAETQEKCLSGG